MLRFKILRRKGLSYFGIFEKQDSSQVKPQHTSVKQRGAPRQITTCTETDHPRTARQSTDKGSTAQNDEGQLETTKTTQLEAAQHPTGRHDARTAAQRSTAPHTTQSNEVHHRTKQHGTQCIAVKQKKQSCKQQHTAARIKTSNTTHHSTKGQGTSRPAQHSTAPRKPQNIPQHRPRHNRKQDAGHHTTPE